ncbi:hypothetical protein, partial [Streptomyces adustus]|uniref:hypothetical protein n=1 Tax=Streptomyces adustus TaxID=1609272 RepID=UPI001EE4ABB9
DPLTKRLPFRRQPTTLRIPHTTGIPQRSHIVSPQRHHAAKVSSRLLRHTDLQRAHPGRRNKVKIHAGMMPKSMAGNG